MFSHMDCSSERLEVLLDLHDGLVLRLCIDDYVLVLYCVQEAIVRTECGEVVWFPYRQRYQTRVYFNSLFFKFVCRTLSYDKLG